MTKTDERMILIAAALNGILARGSDHYNDGPYTLDTPIRIATLAVRLADATLRASRGELNDKD